MKESILLKYIKGETSPSEDSEVYSWINSSESNRKEYSALRNILVFSSMPEDTVSEIEAEKAIGNILSRERNLKSQGFVKRHILYAACLIGLLLVSTLTYIVFLNGGRINTDIVVSCGDDSVKFIVLPDNTRLTLNKNSMVKYPEKFGVRKRNIYAEGEVFFEVSKMKGVPFVLSTKSGIKIKVLGTKFLFNDSHEYFTTVLLEGKVRVQLPPQSKAIVKDIFLNPQEKITITTDYAVSIDYLDSTENIMSWREELLNFKNAYLDDILTTLSSYYGTQLSCCPSIKKMMLTINLNNKSLDEFVSLVEHSLDVGHLKTVDTIYFRKFD